MKPNLFSLSTNTFHRRLAYLFISMIAVSGTLSAVESYTYNIATGSDLGPTYEGCGVSFTNSTPPGYGGLSRNVQLDLANRLWNETGANVVRLWFNLTEFNPSVDTYSTTKFQERIIDSLILSDALAAGADTLLLAPTNIPKHLRTNASENASDFSDMEIKDDAAAADYGAVVAEAVIRLNEDHGILVDATGIQNEPNARVDFSPSQLAIAGAAIRAALDAASSAYDSVEIIGPECASVDGTCNNYVLALQANTAAWAALDGIAAHSYNMALKSDFAPTWLSYNRPYWNTESGNTVLGPDDLPLNAFASLHGADLATRFTNDLRHGCSYWIWFVGYAIATNDFRDQQRLIRWQNDETIEELPTYAYFSPLAQAFQPGTRIQTVSSDIALVDWTYGRKPRLSIAVGERPDGSVAIGIVNYTSANFPDTPTTGSNFYKSNVGRPAANITVNLDLSSMNVSAQGFNLVRVGQDVAPLVDQLNVPTSNSVVPFADTISITLNPMEMAVYTSYNAVTTTRAITMSNPENVTWDTATPGAQVLDPNIDGEQVIGVDSTDDAVLEATSNGSG